MAKEVIHGINIVANETNKNPNNDKICVVFVSNYDVFLACYIIPAPDLWEQISTAGKEASGTGNIERAMNGTYTICKLDATKVALSHFNIACRESIELRRR
jgi:starch phosphorylase